MNAMVDFGLLCTQLGFGSNWYSAVGTFCVLVGFVVLFVSAYQKLDAATKAEQMRQAASKSWDEARRVAAEVNEALSSLGAEVARFSALLSERDRQIAEKNAEAERRVIAQRGVQTVRKLREDAMANFKRSDEADFVGLAVERTSLRYAVILIVAGLSAQIAGNFPGC
jgi:hypothetical protein